MSEEQAVYTPTPIAKRDAPVAQLAAYTANPMQLIAIAVQQGRDLQTIEKLMDLQERHETRQARKAFDAALSDAKSEIQPIFKAQEVDFTNREGKRTHYTHEDLAGIAAEVDPVLAKYGLSYRYKSRQEGKMLTLICVLSHRDGHTEEAAQLVGPYDESGNKNPIQAIGSTATYLQRYTLKLALGLAASKDDDGVGGATDKTTLSAEHVAQLTTLLADNAVKPERMLTYWKISKLEDALDCNFETMRDDVGRFVTARNKVRAEHAGVAR